LTSFTVACLNLNSIGDNMRTQTTNLGTEIISASAVSTIAQTISQSDKAFLEFFKKRLEEILEICQRKKIDGLIVVSGKRNKDDRYIVKIMETRQYLDFPSSLNYLFLGCRRVKKVKYETVLKAKQKAKRPYMFYMLINNEWYMYEAERIISGGYDL
jgi:hypothetical protein